MTVFSCALLGAGVVLTPLSLISRHQAVKKLAGISEPTKRELRPRKIATAVSVVGVWLIVAGLVTLLFGTKGSRGLEVEIMAPRWTVFGVEISSTVILTWVLLAVWLVIGLLIRFFVVPRMTEQPHGVQRLLEIAVEEVAKYTDSRVPGYQDGLGAYIFTLAVFMVSCAALELFGLRAPTADLTMTFSMALVTFALINWFGIRRKGVLGRIKSFAYPTPVVFPFKIISDIAVPVSLACRLFGNMLGGMIVMDLLYMAMGNLAIGIPSILGLYFNVFHPLIQAFIFVTLSLTFIGEAIEEPEK